jgi:hypothetical protein
MCRGTAFPTPPMICEQELPFIPHVIGMLSHQQYSHAPWSKQRSGPREEQSHKRVKFKKKNTLYLSRYGCFPVEFI